jgi:hypothetical protein
MNMANAYTRQEEEREAARKLYKELVWRLAFLKEKGPAADSEPTEQQIVDWYRQVHKPAQILMFGEMKNEAKSISQHFQQLFPEQTAQFGPACLETGLADSLGQVHSQPLMINHDTMAASLSDPRIGLDVIYYAQDMEFYYSEPFHPIYRPVNPDRLQCLYRGLILRTASLLTITNAKLNVWAEFRSDKNCRLIIQRAKAILSVASEFFSPTSNHQRIRGQELMERVARKFVDEMLTSEPGQMLKLADAFSAFRGLLKLHAMPDIKRSDFHTVVTPLIKQTFNICLRNDLARSEGSGVRGWKNVRLVQTGPLLN